ncbi:MAG: hypothetical protein ACP5D0_09790, partial [Hydrogenovibrio sp.]
LLWRLFEVPFISFLQVGFFFRGFTRPGEIRLSVFFWSLGAFSPHFFDVLHDVSCAIQSLAWQMLYPK